MRQIRIGNTHIAYDVRELPDSEKLSIHVRPGRVEVVVPNGTDDDVIEDFVTRRRRWIFDKVDEVEEAHAKLLKTQPSRFATGAKIPYRGRMMRLFVRESDKPHLEVTYDNGFFVWTPNGRKVTDAEIKAAVEFWMKVQVEKDCRLFVRRYSNKVGEQPAGIRIKNQKHLWGSLGKDHILNINWHLAFAPRQILEYVVAHEVCHLKHRSHSGAFWRLLRSVFRDTDPCKRWLERNKSVWDIEV